MSEKVVKVIPIKKEVVSKDTVKKLRVCGYARVSTDNDEQANSYKSQVEYYTNFIKKNPDWEFLGLYSDEGVSGVMTKGRSGFNKMILEAKKGNIDLIITKSISRFARNTVDALQTIRELKEHNVEVFFEKENIRTLDSKGELMLSILSSLAQDESRSISENVQWGIRKRFQDGHARLRSTNFLGFMKDENGKAIVNQDEAKIIKKIYRWFLDGQSYATISKFLMNEHIKTLSGIDYWRPHIVKSILTNERYMGDALCQKYYTVDYMKKQRKKNDGKIEQYYVENNHEAIISKDIFNIAQEEIKRRSGHFTSTDIIANKTLCGYCGDKFRRCNRYLKDGKQIFFYRCLNKDEYGCYARVVYEEDIKKMFIEAVNYIVSNKEDIMKGIKEELEKAQPINELKRRKENQEKRLSEIVDKINEYIYKSAKTNNVPKEDVEKYKENYQEYKKASKTTKRLIKEYEEAVMKRDKMIKFLDGVKNQEMLEKFSHEAWGNLVDKFIVYNDKIIIKFYGNFEYEFTDFEKYKRIKPVPIPSTYQINKLRDRVNMESKESVDEKEDEKEDEKDGDELNGVNELDETLATSV